MSSKKKVNNYINEMEQTSKIMIGNLRDKFLAAFKFIFKCKMNINSKIYNNNNGSY